MACVRKWQEHWFFFHKNQNLTCFMGEHTAKERLNTSTWPSQEPGKKLQILFSKYHEQFSDSSSHLPPEIWVGVNV